MPDKAAVQQAETGEQTAIAEQGVGLDLQWHKVEISNTGFRTKETLTYEEWEAIGQYFIFIGQAMPWLLGDWLNAGEAAYGDKYTQALDASEYQLQTLLNYASICWRVPPERRVPDLSFAHHAEVAALGPDEQVKMLAKAVKEEWCSKDLRKAVSDQRVAAGKKALPAVKYAEFRGTWERHGLPFPSIPSDKCIVQVAKLIDELERNTLPENHVAVSKNLSTMLVKNCAEAGMDGCDTCKYHKECRELTEQHKE